jgi:hypothetical protein
VSGGRRNHPRERNPSDGNGWSLLPEQDLLA